MKKILAVFFVFAALSRICAAFEASDATHFTDDRGQAVSLKNPVQKIVSLEPALTETLYIIGQFDKVVGLALSESSLNWPEAVKEKTSVGSIRNVSLETLVALEPDLVIGSAMSERGLAAAAKLGIPTAFISPNSLDEILRTMKALGRLLGAEEAARKTADEYALRIEEIRRKAPGQNSTGFFVYAVNPIMIFGGGSLPGEVLNLAGIRNPLAKVSFSRPAISQEEILAADPDYIFLAMGAAASQADLKNHPFWSRLRAVKNGNLMAPPAEYYLRPSPRIVLGVEAFYDFVYGGRR
ncbi:MAG: ABC transporter substrate-binding protein [Spirochaetales bacterium]|jgi:ABC-type Fe3+-hydroxamate transport system substrate-binding protein|nr:ABC transporter substrate-binding protein [Spirochaetales bacterium]